MSNRVYFDDVTYIGPLPPSDFDISSIPCLSGQMIECKEVNQLDALFGVERTVRSFAIFSYFQEIFYKLRRLFGLKLIPSIDVTSSLNIISSELEEKKSSAEEADHLIDLFLLLQDLQSTLDGCLEKMRFIYLP